MINSTLDKSDAAKDLRKSNLLIAVTLVIFIVICLGLISLMTTTGMWDGAFPSGEYHIKIEAEKGNPIEGAVLNIFDGKTRNFAFEYPIDNYFSEKDLISDEKGIIIVLHTPRGFEFGGGCWSLFWIFQICSSSPEYYGQISAEGYKTFTFSLDKLFDLAYNGKSNETVSMMLESGETLEISIYEITFTLKK